MKDSDDHPDSGKEVVHVPVQELPIMQIGGEVIRLMFGTFPRLTIPMDMGYARGTHLKVELEARVRRVAVDEMTSGKHKGETYAEHTLVIESARIVHSYTAEEADPGVGGGLSSAEQLKEQEEEEQDGAERERIDFDAGF